MRRSIRLSTVLLAAVALALAAGACGTLRVHVPKSDPDYASDVAAANIFHQRCGGCHTLSYAATSGSGPNPRTYLDISGPNFNVRCERPVDRVLYAIENGGFSGAYMPQNIVVGQQAREVAMFVARYAGHLAVAQTDSTPCDDQPIGTLPALPTSTNPTQLEAGVTQGTSTSAANTTTNAAHISAGSPNDESASNPSPNGGT